MISQDTISKDSSPTLIGLESDILIDFKVEDLGPPLASSWNPTDFNASKTYKPKYHKKFTINDMCFNSYPCYHVVTIEGEEPAKMSGEGIYALFVDCQLPIPEHFMYCHYLFVTRRMCHFLSKNKTASSKEYEELLTNLGLSVHSVEKCVYETENKEKASQIRILKCAIETQNQEFIETLLNGEKYTLDFECLLKCLEFENQQDCVDMFFYVMQYLTEGFQGYCDNSVDVGGNNLLSRIVYHRQYQLLKILLESGKYTLALPPNFTQPILELTNKRRVDTKKIKKLSKNAELKDVDKITKPGVYFNMIEVLDDSEIDVKIADLLLEKSVEQNVIYSKDIYYLKKVKISSEKFENAFEFLKHHNLVNCNELNYVVNIYDTCGKTFEEYKDELEKLSESGKEATMDQISQLAALNSQKDAKINLQYEIARFITPSDKYRINLPKNIFMASWLKKIEIAFVLKNQESFEGEINLSFNGSEYKFYRGKRFGDFGNHKEKDFFTFESIEPIPYKNAMFCSVFVNVLSSKKEPINFENFQFDITYQWVRDRNEDGSIILFEGLVKVDENTRVMCMNSSMVFVDNNMKNI
jgi:hypothetical protein